MTDKDTLQEVMDKSMDIGDDIQKILSTEEVMPCIFALCLLVMTGRSNAFRDLGQIALDGAEMKDTVAAAASFLALEEAARQAMIHYTKACYGDEYTKQVMQLNGKGSITDDELSSAKTDLDDICKSLFQQEQ